MCRQYHRGRGPHFDNATDKAKDRATWSSVSAPIGTMLLTMAVLGGATIWVMSDQYEHISENTILIQHVEH